MSDKPHYGKISGWTKCPARSGLGFYIEGDFEDHPNFKGRFAHTSYVVAHDEKTGEIETKNSRYTLVGQEKEWSNEDQA